MKNTTSSQAMTTGEIAERFNELAQQEKWFEIQEEFFSDNVKSIDPPKSPYFGYAEGGEMLERKAKNLGKRLKPCMVLQQQNP